jgi:hypothetical protein
MAKYQKIPTVVTAYQAHTTNDFGVLGNLVCTDWIIKLYDGTLHTMDNSTFGTKYASTNDNTTETGTDWD